MQASSPELIKGATPFRVMFNTILIIWRGFLVSLGSRRGIETAIMTEEVDAFIDRLERLRQEEANLLAGMFFFLALWQAYVDHMRVVLSVSSDGARSVNPRLLAMRTEVTAPNMPLQYRLQAFRIAMNRVLQTLVSVARQENRQGIPQNVGIPRPTAAELDVIDLTGDTSSEEGRAEDGAESVPDGGENHEVSSNGSDFEMVPGGDVLNEGDAAFGEDSGKAKDQGKVYML